MLFPPPALPPVCPQGQRHRRLTPMPAPCPSLEMGSVLSTSWRDGQGEPRPRSGPISADGVGGRWSRAGATEQAWDGVQPGASGRPAGLRQGHRSDRDGQLRLQDRPGPALRPRAPHAAPPAPRQQRGEQPWASWELPRFSRENALGPRGLDLRLHEAPVTSPRREKPHRISRDATGAVPGIKASHSRFPGHPGTSPLSPNCPRGCAPFAQNPRPRVKHHFAPAEAKAQQS